MAGQKRALSQTDSNVAKSQPPSKRQSQQLAAGKENATHDYTGLKKLDLCTLLQQRNLPYSGNKDVLIRRLEDSDRDHSSARNSGRATGKGHATAQTIAPEFNFLTLCRPWEDVEAEKQVNGLEYDPSEEYEEEDEAHSEVDEDEEAAPGDTSMAGQRKSICGKKKCICKLPASEHPEHNWILTTEGYRLVARLQWEIEIRDQDKFGEHFFSDFNGYGFQEVMENQLLSFDREFSKGSTREEGPSPAGLWSIIEGFAWALNYQGFWFNIDYPDMVLATLKLIGGAVFTTLNILDKNGLLRPDTPVKNIALVLGVLYDNTRDWPGDEEGELEWRAAMIKEVLQHGIEFKGAPYGIERLFETDGLDRSQLDKPDSRWKKWKRFDWPKEFRSFFKRFRKGPTIGGRQFALESKADLARVRKTWGSIWNV
ncbi:uncharacterized protein A1O5_04960 [Cladophialophora psammophila CBS 110553]|uniref:SAP domain-containing protein n=1 Tax=Cladophialophora psammophila CBS 110553 TaxID=1182543 RepID=W9X6B9_9EURO|nr:uncharacterized protein A1O5_04960 [Cladophialophora psammophila CBS 110553]EXJ72456.1 hypothetical protein A1O5_04960 [Cladophialophora psammophila CBS 110553]